MHISNISGEILFEKNWKKKTIFTQNDELINASATEQFYSLWLILFPLLLMASSWNLHKLLNFICSFNVSTFFYIYGDVFYWLLFW